HPRLNPGHDASRGSATCACGQCGSSSGHVGLAVIAAIAGVIVFAVWRFGYHAGNWRRKEESRRVRG
ncbi:MAG: hypothetical protein JXQ73_25175, partial [Phycisphaerae bacterium]|nr:hypothetical protein [Phycisphaerae bacterium]